LDVSGLFDDAGKIESRLAGMGKFAGDTFQKQIARELARSISPESFQKEANQARVAIMNFGADAKKIFEQTLGANQAKRIFDPIRNEANTFKGQLRASLGEAFDVKKIAIGSLTGILGANLIQNVIGGIANIGTATVNLAKDAIETRAKFDEVFKDMADQTRIWANSFADSVGRARIDVEGWLATLQDTFVPLGFAREKASDMSKQLVELAVDVASFNNQADAKVIEDFQSAIVGNTETVRKYGIVILQSTLEQEALAQGINKSFKELTEQEKAWLRLQIITKSTTDAQGDAIRTADSLANQQKRLEANIKNLGESLGGFLLPAINKVVTGFNDFFALLSKSDVEEFNAALQRINADESTKSFETFGQEIENSRVRANDLASDIDKIAYAGVRLDDATNFTARLFEPATVAIDELRRKMVELSKTEEGRIDIQRQINEAIQRGQDFANQKKQAELSGETELSAKLQDRVIAEAKFVDFAEKVLNLAKQRVAEERKAILLDEFRALATTEEGIVEIRKRGAEALKQVEALAGQIAQADSTSKAELQGKLDVQKQILSVASRFVELQDETAVKESQAVDLTRLTVKELEKRKQLYPAESEAIDAVLEKMKEQKKLAEDVAKFLADAAKKLELFDTVGDVEQKLVAIRQEADERRKQFAGQAKAIEAVNKLERAERRKTIDDFEKQLEKEVKSRIEKIVKFDIEPKLITDLKLPDIEFDEQRAKTIGERINKTLNETLVESPASVVLNKIAEIGPLLDEEFINFVGVIDKGLADVLAGIANFATNIASGNILGAITGAVGVIGGLFGGGNSARKKAEVERQQQQAQEEAARAAERAAQALDDLRRAAEEFGSGKLVDEIKRLDDEISQITNSTRKLTQEELERAVVLLDQANTIRNNIALIRSLIEAAVIEGRSTEDLDRQLRELEEQIAPLEAVLNELGINLNEITPLEVERLNVLLEERGILDDVVNKFGAFGDGIRGLIDRLQFGFDFIATEPAKKLEKLLAAVTETFGFEIPEQFNSLQEFILAAVEAMQAGGQTLIDFLSAAGLEELTADEFADFLRTLDEFSKGVEGAGNDVASAFEKLLEGFGFVTDILDVEEPRERLQTFRNAVNTTFGADISESFDAMKAFILNGFIALQGDAESLKAFLASIGLEELTREEFENLLHELEGGLDAIASKFAELTDQLNLQFDLLDIDNPIEKLKKLQSEILKRFGAVIPTTKEEIDALIASGVDALLAGGDALKVFLASIDLEELTASEFEELLRRLKDFGKEAAAQIEGATQAAEEITTSQVKSITFTQGNKLIDEVITMRVVLTQMLDAMRGGLIGSFQNINLDNLAAALTGLNGANNNYFIVRNGNIESISENQLSEIDRKLIEQARRSAQARGVS